MFFDEYISRDRDDFNVLSLIYKNATDKNDNNSAPRLPAAKAMQAYSIPLGRTFNNKSTVRKIFISCSAKTVTAFLYAFRTAVKYPLSAEDSAINGREIASIFRGLMVRRSSSQ